MYEKITALYWPAAVPKKKLLKVSVQIDRHRSLYSLFRRWHSIIRPNSVLVIRAKVKRKKDKD